MSEKAEGVMDALIRYAEEIKAKEQTEQKEEPQQEEPQPNVMQTEGDVTWKREELYPGFRDWNQKLIALVFHKFSGKLFIFFSGIFIMTYLTALFMMAIERDSVYRTTGESVRFEYERPLFSVPGYDIILKRREFHDKRKTIAEVVREERERELELQEFQLKRMEYEKQKLRLSKLPDAPGDDILGVLGKGPGGH
mgnify:FL=1